jgi:hypothetical protein
MERLCMASKELKSGLCWRKRAEPVRPLDAGLSAALLLRFVGSTPKHPRRRIDPISDLTQIAHHRPPKSACAIALPARVHGQISCSTVLRDLTGQGAIDPMAMQARRVQLIIARNSFARLTRGQPSVNFRCSKTASLSTHSRRGSQACRPGDRLPSRAAEPGGTRDKRRPA